MKKGCSHLKIFSNFSQKFQILVKNLKILVFVLVGSVKKFYFGSVTDPDLCIFPGSVIYSIFK